MSYVVCVASERSATIMSDGRGINIYGDVDVKDINKTRKISNNIILGFAGEYDTCIETLSYIENLVHVNAIDCALELSKPIYESLKEKNNLSKSGFIIVAKNSTGKIDICTFGLDKDELIHVEPQKDRIGYSQLCPTDYSGSKDILVSNLTVNDINLSYENRMLNAINEMASLSHLVGGNVHSISL